MKGRGLVVALLVLGACSRSSDRPTGDGGDTTSGATEPGEPARVEPPPDPEEVRARAAEALLARVDELAKIHREHGDDCSALATALRSFHGEHGAELAEAPSELLAYVDGDALLRERMRAAMESVMTAAMGCREDPSFVATQAELFGPKGE